MTPRTRYSFYILISAVAAAAGLVITEIALRFFCVTALFIAFVSNIIGGLFLLAPTLTNRSITWRGWPATDWLRLIISSIAIYALGFVLLYSAIDHIGSSKTSLLGRLEAVFVIGLAVIFLGERWSKRHWLASFLALGGAIVVNFDSAAWQLSVGLGELISVLGALCFSTGIVTLKPLLDRRDGQFVTGIGLLLGAFFMAPFLIATEPNAWTWNGLGWMALAALTGRGLCLGISWATYNTAMRHLGASRCSVLFLSVVFLTVALQVIVDALAPSLGLQVPENLLTALAGGLIIALAIALIHRQV
jgi:drug/metabolite transporter (DMT)-like permease